LTIPHRGTTSESTYFVTANVFQKKSLFQVEKIARLFIEVLLNYRTKKKCEIGSSESDPLFFAIMPMVPCSANAREVQR